MGSIQINRREPSFQYRNLSVSFITLRPDLYVSLKISFYKDYKVFVVHTCRIVTNRTLKKDVSLSHIPLLYYAADT